MTSAMDALIAARLAWEKRDWQQQFDFDDSAPNPASLQASGGVLPGGIPVERGAETYVGEPTAGHVPPDTLRDPDRRADGSRRGSSPTTTSNGVSAQSFPAVARPPRKGV